jgi:putative PIN family toxin of toxin-antitoxin system
MTNAKNNRIVIDTNTLISAVIIPKSVPAQALKKALEHYVVCISEETEQELVEVISRPKFDKYFVNNTYNRESFLRVFLACCIKVTPRLQVQDCRDPKDDKFLSVALEAKAVMLVTGDKKDLLSMNPYKDVAIISARAFLELA